MWPVLPHERRGLRSGLCRATCGRFPFRGEFDAVVNMFTAFGYFDDDADDQRVIDGAAAALKAGRSAAAGSSEQGLGCCQLRAQRVARGTGWDGL